MARTLYLAAAGPDSGKSVIALGLFEAMSRRVSTVAAFRPVVRAGEPDPLLGLLATRYGIDVESSWGVTYDDLHQDPVAAISTIVERFHQIERGHEAALVIGTDYTDVGATTELDFNARVALNLGAPVLLVVDGHLGSAPTDRSGDARTDPAELAVAVDVAHAVLLDHGCQVLGSVINRVPHEQLAAVRTAFWDRPEVSVLPLTPLLGAPRVHQVFSDCGAELVFGSPGRLGDEALGFVVAAMTLPRVLEYLTPGCLVILPGDRTDLLVGVLMAHRSQTFPRLAGILLTGGLVPEDPVQRLIEGLGSRLPVALTDRNTFESATMASRSVGNLTDGSPRKVEAAHTLVAEHVDTTALLDRLDLVRSQAVTPLMFEHDLAERARANRQRIVLPEGTEARVLRAAATVLQRGLADVILLGNPDQVRAAAARAGADISAATVLDPFEDNLRTELATEYARLRAHKGLTVEAAWDVVSDVSYAGTLLVKLGRADGMVSGAAHTTAHTIRPAFEIIRTTPGVSIVSSVFFMCLADRVLVYGDCAVNPDPTAEQLADIAISSAATAASFGVAPRVALLSYSTGESGHGVDVDKVRTATKIVREQAPELEVEGPIQYDAATDIAVAAAKLPGSTVAGRATVLIFPDLNTGNNTYKAVQRSAGALAVGPVLQGLRQPVNDLSRGATIEDIVTTIMITAVQAGQLTVAHQ